jgi:hypothetical protein
MNTRVHISGETTLGRVDAVSSTSECGDNEETMKSQHEYTPHDLESSLPKLPGVTGDTLHRGIKMAMDSGEASTLAEATALFQGYRLAVVVDAPSMRSPTMQAALLTIVNTARRGFLGGVDVLGVTGALDAPLAIPLSTPWMMSGDRRGTHSAMPLNTVGDAVRALSGIVVDALLPSIPCVVLGDIDGNASAAIADSARDRSFAIRVTYNGWAGGVVPLDHTRRLSGTQECAPAGVLAGAMAVSEAFQSVRGGNPAAGRRPVGMSLWQPDAAVDWLSDTARGPAIELLPSSLWLVGLGHLGQAFLWTLGFLPYETPSAVQLMLQDHDTLVNANDSTSPLTTLSLVGQKKARAMASWAEARGFCTTITERRFNASTHVADGEPRLALVGVDNPDARMAVEEVGFGAVIEAGLGKTRNEYLAFQMHRFPGPQCARARWSPDTGEQVLGSGTRSVGDTDIVSATAALLAQPAYRALEGDAIDSCGLTLLANRSVGAPFVGTAVSTLVVAEVLKLLIGAPQSALIDGSLRSPARRRVVGLGQIPVFNPGYTLARR